MDKPKNFPIEPKTQQYLSNGTGRDYYIKINDGGLTKFNQVRSFTGGKFIIRRNEKKNDKPLIDAKTIFYHSDGSGRDNYIIVNEGGLSRFNKTNFDYKYVQDLRTYEKYITDDSNGVRPDYFQISQYFRNSKQMERDNINFQIQTKLTQRLATPKTTQNPYQYPNTFQKRSTKKILYK